MDCELKVEGGVIRIAGCLTVQTAAALWPTLLSEVCRCAGQARLDVRAVNGIDAAGLQILLMIRRLARGAGTRFALIAPSSCVREVITLCGLGEDFPIAEEAP